MKILCIGRNYADHAKELNNPLPESPLVFMKPSTALLVGNKPFYYPDFTKDLHHEVEIVLRIVKNGRHVAPEFANTYYSHVGLGIDFTARDVQKTLKKKGHPWEIAKAFDHSAPLSKFIHMSSLPDRHAIKFQLFKNDELVQDGNTKDLIFSFDTLVSHLSRYFRLQVGDLVFTGTPSGVGPVQIGDVLRGKIEEEELLSFEIR